MKFIHDKQRGDYFAEHNSTIRAVKFKGELAVYGGGGGSETKIIKPSPPQAPSVAESMGEYVKALPQLYEAQMEYRPKLAAQQVGLAEEFATPAARAIREGQRELYPETTALTEQLAKEAGGGMEEGLSPEEEEYYRSRFAGQLGTNVGSPIGAEATAKNLLMERQKRQDYFRNLGLSVSGRAPLAQPQTPQTPNFMSQFQPAQALNYQASTYGTYAGASRPMVTQQQQPNIMGGVGAGLQGLGTVMGALPLSSKRFKKNIKLWA